MRIFNWSLEKNRWLKSVRGISFEDVEFHIANGGLLDVIQHHNQERYSNQRIFIVNIDGYAWMIPFLEDKEGVWLKTAIPSRKLTRKYLWKEGYETDKRGTGDTEISGE